MTHAETMRNAIEDLEICYNQQTTTRPRDSGNFNNASIALKRLWLELKSTGADPKNVAWLGKSIDLLRAIWCDERPGIKQGNYFILLVLLDALERALFPAVQGATA